MHLSSAMTGFSHKDLFIARMVVPFWSSTAWKGQILPQAPQSMQMPVSMTCRDFLSPEMAFTGQILTHAVHPVQDVEILWLMNKPPIWFLRLYQQDPKMSGSHGLGCRCPNPNRSPASRLSLRHPGHNGHLDLGRFPSVAHRSGAG
jgi:hypothetical protein